VSEAEAMAAEVERKVWALALAHAEGNETRWDAVLASMPPEVAGAVFRAMCATMVGLYADLVTTWHKVPDPMSHVLEGLREQVNAHDG
jgi:hypothetical protein